MEDNQNIHQEITLEAKSKKTIERSAAYPAYSIEESLSFVNEVYGHFRNSYAKRDDILNLIKGTNNSKIASCGHYGLLDRQKDAYKISDLYKTIVNNITDQEKKEALLQAFNTPNLNKELIEKFDGDVVPEKLSVHLFRFHGITEAAAPSAAEVFLNNARYVGALDASNKLRYKDSLAGIIFSSTETPLVATPSVKETVVHTAPTYSAPIDQHIQQKVSTPLLLVETTNEEKLTIKLTEGKRAYLSYPTELNERDISILKLQLESLALTL